MDENGDPPVGSFTRLINENGDVRALMGRAAFDNMFKGNVDLLEFSQQTIQEGVISETEIKPSRDLHRGHRQQKMISPHSDKPTWGFGSQFGMVLEVAKALEGKSLAMDPALHTDAEKLLQFFTSSDGQATLVGQWSHRRRGSGRLPKTGS